MRLFIAFDTSKEAKDEIVKAQKKLAYSRLALVREFHMTLKFLGEVKDDKVAEIEDRLGRLEFSGFEAYTHGIGFFPPEGDIRVVWVGLEPKDKITELQRMIEDSLKGLFPEDDRFYPHITIARVKAMENKKLFKDSVNSIKIGRIKFDVAGIKLIKSTLMPSGPVYGVLKEYKAR